MSAHAHAHDSWFHRITGPFRKIYHGWYIPWILTIANYFGGRKDAGRLGRYSRLIRLAGNAISLGSIGLAVLSMGFSSFWAGGAALSIGYYLLFGLGIAINTLGLALGSGANHLKIEQYYDAELEIHALSNELRDQPLRFPRDWNKNITKAVRTTHDVNGIMGTVVSWVTGLSELLLFLSLPAYSISVETACILFVVSRASALISATGAWATNQLRLWTYKKSLETETQAYYGLKDQNNGQRHQQILSIVESAFEELNIDKDHKYSDWVFFRSYRAIEARYPEVIPEGLSITNLLDSYVDHSDNIFDRNILRNLSENESDVLDNMPLLEMKLFYALNNEAPQADLINYHVDVLRAQENEEKTGYPEAFEPNKPEICAAYPVEASAHGTSFLPYYHSRKLAGEFVQNGVINEGHALRVI